MSTPTSETCTWEQEDQDSTMFNSDCGMSFYFEDDGPEENDFKFCPKCGKPLTVVLCVEEEEHSPIFAAWNSDSMTDEEYKAFEKIFESGGGR